MGCSPNNRSLLFFSLWWLWDYWAICLGKRTSTKSVCKNSKFLRELIRKERKYQKYMLITRKRVSFEPKFLSLSLFLKKKNCPLNNWGIVSNWYAGTESIKTILNSSDMSRIVVTPYGFYFIPFGDSDRCFFMFPRNAYMNMTTFLYE